MSKRKAPGYVELNANGTVKIIFSDEETFKRSREIVQRSLSDESRTLLEEK